MPNVTPAQIAPAMFFWTRSLLCIGAVVVLVSGRSPEAIGPAASKLTGEVATGLLGATAMHLCQSAPDRCMALVKQGVNAGWNEAALRSHRPAEIARSKDRRAAPSPAL